MKPVNDLYPEQILKEGVMPVAVVSQSPFRTWGNYNKRVLSTERFEKVDPKSETVPDQSLTVAELVYRYTNGKPLGGKVGVYDDDFEIDVPANWSGMDLSEKMEWMSEKRKEYQDITDRIQEQQNLMHKQAQEAEIDRRVQEKLAANKENRDQERVQSVINFKPAE